MKTLDYLIFRFFSKKKKLPNPSTLFEAQKQGLITEEEFLRLTQARAEQSLLEYLKKEGKKK